MLCSDESFYNHFKIDIFATKRQMALELAPTRHKWPARPHLMCAIILSFIS
jgi:hypothetical protein